MGEGKKEDIRFREQLYNVIRNVLMHWNYLLLFGVIIAIAADFILTVTWKPVYRAEASFAIKMSEHSENGETQDEISEALGYILTSNVFLEEVQSELGDKHLNGNFTTSAVPGTNIINISAQADSPQTAYRMMYAMMERYQEITELVIGNMRIELLEKMEVPMAPDNVINHGKNFILFGAAGMAAVLLYYVATALMRNTIQGKSSVKEKLQLRLLAAVPSEPKVSWHRGRLLKKKALLITQITSSKRFVEAFHYMRNRIESISGKYHYKVLIVNSVMENEGKTSVMVNIAISFAQKGKKVLLVDADLGKPALAKILDMKPEVGLEEVLQGKVSIEEAICHHDRLHLDLVMTKNAVDTRSELLESDFLKDWLAQCKEQYDYILLDTPPSGIMGDAMILAQYSDGVILVVRQDYAPTAFINRTVEKYLAQDTPVIGCVLNRSIPHFGIGGSGRGHEGGEQ